MPVRKKKNLPENVHVRSDGTWDIRVTFLNDEGRRESLKQVCHSRDKEEVKVEVAKMKERIRRLRLGLPLEDAPATFADLADRYAKVEMAAAVFQNGKQISGRKSVKPLVGYIKLLKEHFGARRPAGITYGDLKKFKQDRLNAPVYFGKDKKQSRPRAVSSVNREMSLLRAVFFFGVREGWLDRNPFHSGKPLISLADEYARTNLWTRDEENCALEYCVGLRRHLRTVIVMIVNGGFRTGELLLLEWRQVDFTKNEINLEAAQTKDGENRTVPMNAAMKTELLEWRKLAPAHKQVFGGIRAVRRSWVYVRNKINRPDLTLKDLRSVFASRLAALNVPISQVAKLLGHSSSKICEKFYVIVRDSELHAAVDKL